ncbi:hypothetical protein BESB_002990 [Besnoitia besnoiti]|uniref:Uncharacterized protein n=1 Tax=Besnoitia besnoiti TaxID=94643 RepID=A0A2A9MHE5_BESBE|nr:hypothetical protein BESB_002990 [Besnoitia besnoiti]PFH37958.1 hypothetical protein BESB_002990 [Besnoitia besnoiti]
MAEQSEWARNPDASQTENELPLKSINTADIEGPELHYAGTNVIRETVKSPDEVIEEMRTWLKSGVAPDGTRMMTEEAWQWHQDYYQVTVRSDKHHECLPEGSGVDYYYWETPYLAHVGNMNLVMMHSQVNLPDGTHLPCDRLKAEALQSKRLRQLAEKRVEVQRREGEAFVREAMNPHAHMGAPFRKEGLYTKIMYRPFHRTEERTEVVRAPTVALQARAAEAALRASE